MDKVLVTTLLTMAAVVASVLVINAILPALGTSSSSVLSSSGAASGIIKTDIDVIHVSTNTTTSVVLVWVKNVGAADVLAVSQGDLFLQTPTDFNRLGFDETGAPPGDDMWVFEIEEGGASWQPGSTIKITIKVSSPLAGNYLVRYNTHNGVSAEKAFSV